MMPSRAHSTAAIGLLLLSAATPALAQNNPIPNIDILLQKPPGGSALAVGETGRDGWFRDPIPVEAGEYQVAAACPPRRQCPAFRIAEVLVNGRVIGPDARGRFVFLVGSGIGQVRLEARVLSQPVSIPR